MKLHLCSAEVDICKSCSQHPLNLTDEILFSRFSPPYPRLHLRLTAVLSLAESPSMALQTKALMGTPIACLLLSQRLLLYWFGPIASSSSSSGSPLMRAILGSADGDFEVTTLGGAPMPSGYTQLTAFIKTVSIISNGGGSGTALITYIQSGSNEPYT